MPPVEDHEVHEKVKSTGTEPYGCSNAKQSDGYWIKAREYRTNGTYVMRDTFIPHRMSKDCRNFYLWYTDPRCATCERTKDREYAQRMMHIE